MLAMLSMRIFPDCVAKGSRFTFGGLGLTRVRMTLLLVSATVRNRPRTTVRGLKLPCLWEKPQKRLFLDVSEDVLMSLCLAGVALCDIFDACSRWNVCACDRPWTKVAVPMGKATKTHLSRCGRRCGHVAVAGVALSRRVRRCGHVVLRGRCGAL